MTKSSNRKRKFTSVFKVKPEDQKTKLYVPPVEKKEKVYEDLTKQTTLSLIKKLCKNIKYIQFADGSVTACFYNNNIPYIMENYEDCKVVLKTKPKKMFDISKMKDFPHEDMEADVHQHANV